MKCPFCGADNITPSEVRKNGWWCDFCARPFTITLEPNETLLGVVDLPSRKVTPTSGDEF